MIADPIADNGIVITDPMLETVIHYIKSQGWKAEPMQYKDERKVFCMTFRMRNANYKTYFDVDRVRHIFAVTAYSPINIPEHDRLKICELFTRINLKQMLTRFELNMTDGEVRVSNAACVEGSKLSTEMIEIMENNALIELDKYFPAIMAIVHGHFRVEQALKKVESEDTDEIEECGATH